MFRCTMTLFALLGVAFLAGCSDDTTCPQPDDDIRGRVVDAQGDPVADAWIVLEYEYPGAPGPDKPETGIGFQLPETGPVTAWISSYCDGDTLRMLVDGELPAGQHTVRWDGLDDDQRIVPDGVYRFHLVTESGEDMEVFPLMRLGYGDLAPDTPLAPHAVVDDQGRFTLDQACLGFGFTYEIQSEPVETITISNRVRVWAFSEAVDAVGFSSWVTVDPDMGVDVDLILGR